MSLRDRLFNVAKAELKDAARKIRDGVDGLLGEEPDRRHDFEFEREPSFSSEDLPPLPTNDKETADIRRYYANLELPIGAPLPEVKAAYRRLMRRYHPDRHQKDPDRIKAANELAQRLREAYDGLTAHLEKKA
jgi:DnaJ-domain-containing protein 1